MLGGAPPAPALPPAAPVSELLPALSAIGTFILMIALLSIGTNILPREISAVVVPSRNKDFQAYALALVVTVFFQPLLGYGLLRAFRSGLDEANILGILTMSARRFDPSRTSSTPPGRGSPCPRCWRRRRHACN